MVSVLVGPHNSRHCIAIKGTVLRLCLCLIMKGVTGGEVSPATPPPGGGPELSAHSVVNAADYSSGGVAPGEIVVLFPSNTGPPDMVPWGLDGNMKRTTSIGETRVLFDNVAAIVRCHQQNHAHGHLGGYQHVAQQACRSGSSTGSFLLKHFVQIGPRGLQRWKQTEG